MLRLIGHRLLWSIPVVFVATAISFVLAALVPGNAAETILGQLGTEQQVQLLQAHLGLNLPLPVQYAHWLGHAVHGNLGTSLFSGQTVVADLNQHLGVTLSLLICGTLVSALLGVTLGIMAAVRRGVAGRIVDVFSLMGLAIPNFWLALALTAAFSVSLRWFPVVGYVSIGTSPLQWLHSIVLPVTALSVGPATIIAKQTRDSLRQVLDESFVRTLRANGFSSRSVLYRHALRNAGVPVMTMVGVIFVSLLGGTIFVEQVFAMPGLGSLAVSATTDHDLPVVQGVVVYFTLLVVIVNLVVDLSYGLLDPRVRVR